MLHIGLPKTGTTSLQELVFSTHPQIRYFGQTNLWRDANAKTVLKALLLGDEADLSAARRILSEAAGDRPAIVISDEALTLGEFMLRATRWPVRSDHAAMARRARALLGDAQVLIVLRNQADWIESWRLQGLKSGKYVEGDYHTWLRRDLGAGAERLLALLDYDTLYEAYRNAFGPQHVHVRLYEQYRDRFEDLAAECAGLIHIDAERARQLILEGEPRNVGGGRYSGPAPAAKRLTAWKPVRHILDALPGGLRGRMRSWFERERSFSRLSGADRSAIRHRFAAGNARLARALGLEHIPGDYRSNGFNETRSALASNPPTP